jgi:ABC-type glutathione transport system ATPase component
MMEPVLQIKDLSVAFPNFSSQVTVVRKCSLEVGKGEILGLVGESGSGKTMTAMSCLGLVPKPVTWRNRWNDFSESNDGSEPIYLHW